jgi:hypothetical protein
VVTSFILSPITYAREVVVRNMGRSVEVLSTFKDEFLSKIWLEPEYTYMNTNKQYEAPVFGSHYLLLENWQIVIFTC